MKYCCLCDLHLSRYPQTWNYQLLDWALDHARSTHPDVLLCVGDYTCDGHLSTYRYFLNRVENSGFPCLYIPGNSDLRDPCSASTIHAMSSPLVNHIGNKNIYAVNDSTMQIDSATLQTLLNSEDGSIVFMHHPIECHEPKTQKALHLFLDTHPHTILLCGHLHEYCRRGSVIGLPALDGDKSIGVPPSILNYDDVTDQAELISYPSTVPPDFCSHFGISCMRIREDIPFAIRNHLKNIELRPDIASVDLAELQDLIAAWRESGGENLSVHLPEVAFCNGQVPFDPIYDRVVDIAEKLQADRFTQHVPLCSVNVIQSTPNALEIIARHIAKRLNPLPSCEIGVENMHMTAKDSVSNRRYGYTPEECLEFMNALQLECRHHVGINFDIGHARNNAPFSQNYPIGTWLSLVGPHLIGCHLHQVAVTDNGFENHTAITDLYGKLISYASFFHAWSDGTLKKCPLIFEMRPADAYAVTLNTFAPYFKS